ncbi:hypothetical protein CASFOL_008524 [Castilleja foliolosa]|uniref:non-specific serine/threonine protein kinase n=1 Tax=Castilleja foliolosa TaxID=1961234 RepID=A0ABD3DZ82_9LAMI
MYFEESHEKTLPFDPSDVAEKSPCGNYIRFKKIMGRGAFKDVYKGFDLYENAEIAWNQICFDDEKALNSPENQERLYSEANLLQSLSHSNIMKCYASWIDYDNKTVNMITELFSSGSLRQYIKKLGGVDLQTIKNWGRQILQGLNYLHTRSPCVIHRDLKCDNIFVDINSGEIKIGDFGLAIKMEQAPVRVLAGTPEFMAPEYYDEEYDELVDLYAFGMCLMELTTLEYPYCECTNPAQIFKKVTMGVKPPTLAKVEDFEVKGIIEKCLLPASMRPSALELLKDPFFSSGKNSMDIEMNIIEDQSQRMQSWCTDESILSGISMLYNSMSLSDGGYVVKLPRSCYRSSTGDDVSMNSRITFASSSGAVSKDFCLSKPFLSGKSHV